MVINKLILLIKNLKINFYLYSLIFFSIISSFLEILSISSIIPIMGIIIDANIVSKFPIIDDLFQYFDQLDFIQSQIFENKNYLTLMLIYLMIIVFFVKFVFQIFFEWYRADIVYKIDYKISSYLFNYYLNKPYYFYVDTNTSKLHRNIQGAAGGVSNIFRSIIIIFTETLIVLGLLSLLLYYDWKVTAMTLFLLLVAGSVFMISTSKLNISLGRKVHIHTEKRISHLINGFEGIKDFIIYDKIKSLYKIFDNSNQAYGKANRLFSVIAILPKLIIEFLFIFGILIALLYFSLKEQNLNEFLPLISLFVLSMIRIAPSTFRIINASQQIKFNKTSIDHIYADLMSAIKQINLKSLSQNKYEIKFSKNIQLKNINFSFKKNKTKVIKNLNLSLKKGDCIGIYGDSGSGKSTLLNIITGLFKPVSGNIFCDDVNIHKNIKSWRKNIGYVPQNVYLIDEDIKKNISLNINSKLYNKINLNYALQISGLKKMYKNISFRLKKTLGEKGQKISGGQVQRVGIARAIYQRPNILIFDESTSSLDKDIEKKIFKSIYNLKGKNTILIVSHKLELLKKCDKIYKFKNGQLIQKILN